MKEYFVTWEIDIEADTPREAAEKALAIQRDPTSWAPVFKVFHEDDPDMHTIDLAQAEDNEEEEATLS